MHRLAAFALLAGALAVPAAAAPAAAPAPPHVASDPPPEAMIDFLGRRRLCLELGGADPGLPAQIRRNRERERARLACAALAGEEKGWRARYRGDPHALAWLDVDPAEFELPGIVVNSSDGPPPAHPRRIRQSGTDDSGRHRYAVAVDLDPGGRSVRFAIAFAGRPERRFALAAGRLPWLDLASLRVALQPEPPDDRLILHLRFGPLRGYCADSDPDDRPRLMVTVEGEGRVAAEAQDRVDCGQGWTDVPVAAH